MADAGSQTENHLAPSDHWVARAFEGIPVGQVPRQALARFGGRRVCVNAVAATEARDGWLSYSAAAARRATATDERLAPLVASGQLESIFYVAYDVGPAESLSRHLARAWVSLSENLQLLWGIARAIDAAEEEGVRPIELSPDSVFVDPKRGAVLADLGLAREALGNPPAEIDVNAPWVAPEVLLGGAPDERSRVYSYGAVMFTLLTGTRPDSEHAGEGATADPPSLRRTRPDLPHALDQVIATAMARDPRRRYPSASEARSLAHVVLQEALARSEAAPPPRSGWRSPKAIKPPTRPALGGARLAPKAALLVMGAALAGGAVGGFLLSGGDEAPAAKPVRVAAGDLAVLAPAGWRASPAPAGGLATHPEGDRASGLTLERVDSPVEPAEQATPVRVGNVEAWRDTGAQVDDVESAVRYVIPTTSGKLIATCRESTAAPPGLLEQCERTLSTLRLPAATGLPLAQVVEGQQRWQEATARLSEQRAGARRALAQAERPAGQRLAAEALARVHERAAERFAALPGGEDVAAATRRASDAYSTLARAAGSDGTSRWRAAVEQVRRSEDGLRQALASA